MEYTFRLDGESPELAIEEFRALFGCLPKRTSQPNVYTASLSLDSDAVRSVSFDSAMIQKIYLDGKRIWKSEAPQYPGREPKDKPAFHPTMLKPKLARLLINLARIKEGGRLLDPFCGTGSILIEAHYLDLNPVGIDLDSRAIEKSNINLKAYNLSIKVDIGDATKLEDKYKADSFDGIVTDLPYGRSSTLGGKEIQSLYYNFLKSALKVLKKGHYLVFMKPSYITNKIPAGFKKVGQGDLYAHKGLTRRAVILKKK